MSVVVLDAAWVDDTGSGLLIGLEDWTGRVSGCTPELVVEPSGNVVGGICEVVDLSAMVVAVEVPPGQLAVDDTVSRETPLFDAAGKRLIEVGVSAAGFTCVAGVVTVCTVFTVLVIWG